MSDKNNYVALQAELDEIIAWLESDKNDIDQAIKKYEQGTELVKKLEKYLKSAKNKVQKINNQPGKA